MVRVETGAELKQVNQRDVECKQFEIFCIFYLSAIVVFVSFRFLTPTHKKKTRLEITLRRCTMPLCLCLTQKILFSLNKLQRMYVI